MFRIADRIDALNDWAGRTVAWLTLAMVLLTFAIAILRYLFDLGWIALQELVVYLHVLVFMLGAAYTLKHDEHVRVDVLYNRLGDRGRAVVDFFGTLGLLIPVCLYILIASWGYVARAWKIREGSREAGGLDAVFLLKSVILVMAALLLLQGIARLIRSVERLFGRRPVAVIQEAD